MLAEGRKQKKISTIKVEKQPFLDSLRLTLSSVKALSIGTVVGSFVGLIPGVGGQIAGLLAYDQTKKFSDDSESFGKGNPQGVIAAESANNAMVGPSLVPLLTLSIPGSPTAAVLLGGLLIHGIFPGGDLFERHPDVVWTFINSMLIGQILMVIFGIWVASYAARVAQVPKAIMASAVLVLAVFGAYSVQQSVGDVYIMFVLGVAEANFIQGSMIANAMDGPFAYFMTGSLNVVLMALVIASIGWSFYSSHRESTANTNEPVDPPAGFLPPGDSV